MSGGELIEADPRLTQQIIGAAKEVHKQLGPGLTTTCYTAALVYELIDRGLQVQRNVELPVQYKDKKLDCVYRVDLLVEKTVIVQVQSTSDIAPLHVATLLTHLKVSDYRVGLLINFNVKNIKNGIRKRVVD